VKSLKFVFRGVFSSVYFNVGLRSSSFVLHGAHPGTVQ
jgi:hypothetical protein